MPLRYETVIFDLDGTLIESAPGVLGSMRYTLQTMGVPFPPEAEWRKFLGPPLKFSFQNLAGLDEAQAEEAVKIYRRHYAEQGVFDCALYPGVEKLLRDLNRAGAKVCLATSKVAAMAEKVLNNFKIRDLFYYTEESDGQEAGSSKTAKLARVLEVTGTPPERSVMIGDTRYDAQAARENRLPFIGVLFGYGTRPEMEEAAGGGVYVNNAQELGEILLGK